MFSELGVVWAVSALYQRQVWNCSRSDDRGSPDFNSVQHTVFLHLLQMQPVPGLTCSAKWRLSSGKKKIFSLMGKHSSKSMITILYLGEPSTH